MFLLRILKWSLLVLVVFAVAVVLYLSYGDLNWMKPHIEAAVADATGRQLRLNGPFDIDIVPSPSITLEDVTFPVLIACFMLMPQLILSVWHPPR